MDISLEAWWNGGKSPLLVIQGLADVVAPPENGRSLQADHPERVTLVEFKDLGHEMEIERPDLLAGAIAEFIRRLGN
jgi:pimeloyl-ACP methyl ester carboxylesterase